ncbi:MAG: 1-acyl-sn-glycerol-3-phosphate acyltransferase, partial [Thermoguttaceae bacterium]|nr:1-acyl-sn-glycerol-3-phosphate acyltransferase [Thermoguttaceae bacterium]
IGCGYYGVTSCLARKSLFKSKLFAALISSIDTIPLETEGLGYQGIKETMRRLKNGEAILIFPEGQRCFDGELCEFTTGYANIASKAKATLVPIAISGAFEVFPRTKKYPTLFGPRIVVEYGAPIPPEEYAGLSADEINALVLERIKTMYERNRPRRKK